jgi:hypothetical protein
MHRRSWESSFQVFRGRRPFRMALLEFLCNVDSSRKSAVYCRRRSARVARVGGGGAGQSGRRRAGWWWVCCTLDLRPCAFSERVNGKIDEEMRSVHSLFVLHYRSFLV